MGEVADAHLAEDVLDARVAERGHLLGHARRRSVQRRQVERVANALLVGDLGVGPGVEAGGVDVEAGGVVRFPGVTM